MITLGETRTQILRVLSDPAGETYGVDSLNDAISAAQDAILPWAPKTATTTLTGDGALSAFPLPADLYEVDAVIVDKTGEVLPRSIIQPRMVRGPLMTGTNDWLEIPSGSLTFSKVIPSGETYTLFYLAYWTRPTSDWMDSQALEVPDFVRTGIVLYGSAYAMLSDAVGAAEIGQWKTRVDSGNPEHNPVQKTQAYLFQLFSQEMNRHPRYQRATK